MNRLGLLVVLATLVFGMAACGGGDDDDGADAGSANNSGAAPPNVITIEGSKFSGVDRVTEGESVTVRNEEGFPHTFTPDETGDFQSAALEGGTSASIEMPGPGTYGYHCNIHPSMTGEITVEA